MGYCEIVSEKLGANLKIESHENRGRFRVDRSRGSSCTDGVALKDGADRELAELAFTMGECIGIVEELPGLA